MTHYILHAFQDKGLAVVRYFRAEFAGATSSFVPIIRHYFEYRPLKTFSIQNNWTPCPVCSEYIIITEARTDR